MAPPRRPQPSGAHRCPPTTPAPAPHGPNGAPNRLGTPSPCAGAPQPHLCKTCTHPSATPPSSHQCSRFPPASAPIPLHPMVPLIPPQPHQHPQPVQTLAPIPPHPTVHGCPPPPSAPRTHPQGRLQHLALACGFLQPLAGQASPLVPRPKVPGVGAGEEAAGGGLGAGSAGGWWPEALLGLSLQLFLAALLAAARLPPRRHLLQLAGSRLHRPPLDLHLALGATEAAGPCGGGRQWAQRMHPGRGSSSPMSPSTPASPRGDPVT